MNDLTQIPKNITDISSIFHYIPAIILHLIIQRLRVASLTLTQELWEHMEINFSVTQGCIFGPLLFLCRPSMIFNFLTLSKCIYGSRIVIIWNPHVSELELWKLFRGRFMTPQKRMLDVCLSVCLQQNVPLAFCDFIFSRSKLNNTSLKMSCEVLQDSEKIFWKFWKISL